MQDKLAHDQWKEVSCLISLDIFPQGYDPKLESILDSKCRKLLIDGLTVADESTYSKRIIRSEIRNTEGNDIPVWRYYYGMQGWRNKDAR